MGRLSNFQRANHLPVTFTDTYGSISDETILAFERQSGLALPQDYKDFLLQWNGGRPSQTIFNVPKWDGKGSALHFLFGIHSGKHNNLARWFDELRDRLPDGFLAIGVDMGANFVCLGTSGEFAGEVWYWDSSNRYALCDGTMFKVANRLEAFLNQLRESH
jgi:hypothetical protein